MARKSIAEKVFYKIWDIKNKKYISTGHEKSTWATLNGSQEKVRDLCHPNRYSYSQEQRKPEDFEIQMFHMVQFDRMNGREAYEAKEKKAQAEKLRQQQIAAVRKEINDILPGVDFYRIREMLKQGVFNYEIRMKLENKFNMIAELERPTKI